MSETQEKPKIIFDAVYNEDLKQFEVYQLDEATNTKALCLVQTHEDIIQALKHMMVQALQALAEAAKAPNTEQTVTVPIGTINVEKKD